MLWANEAKFFDCFETVGIFEWFVSFHLKLFDEIKIQKKPKMNAQPNDDSGKIDDLTKKQKRKANILIFFNISISVKWSGLALWLLLFNNKFISMFLFELIMGLTSSIATVHDNLSEISMSRVFNYVKKSPFDAFQDVTLWCIFYSSFSDCFVTVTVCGISNRWNSFKYLIIFVDIWFLSFDISADKKKYSKKKQNQFNSNWERSHSLKKEVHAA